MTYRITVPELREELDRWLDRLAQGDSLLLVTPAQLLTLTAKATNEPNGDHLVSNAPDVSQTAGYWKLHKLAVTLAATLSNAEMMAEARGDR